jgi:hypothetical protein
MACLAKQKKEIGFSLTQAVDPTPRHIERSIFQVIFGSLGIRNSIQND